MPGIQKTPKYTNLVRLDRKRNKGNNSGLKSEICMFENWIVILLFFSSVLIVLSILPLYNGGLTHLVGLFLFLALIDTCSWRFSCEGVYSQSESSRLQDRLM